MTASPLSISELAVYMNQIEIQDQLSCVLLITIFFPAAFKVAAMASAVEVAVAPTVAVAVRPVDAGKDDVDKPCFAPTPAKLFEPLTLPVGLEVVIICLEIESSRSIVTLRCAFIAKRVMNNDE